MSILDGDPKSFKHYFSKSVVFNAYTHVLSRAILFVQNKTLWSSFDFFVWKFCLFQILIFAKVTARDQAHLKFSSWRSSFTKREQTGWGQKKMPIWHNETTNLTESCWYYAALFMGHIFQFNIRSRVDEKFSKPVECFISIQFLRSENFQTCYFCFDQ